MSEKIIYLSQEQERRFAQTRDALLQRMNEQTVRVQNIIGHGGGMLSIYGDGKWAVGYHPEGGFFREAGAPGSDILLDFASFSEAFLWELNKLQQLEQRQLYQTEMPGEESTKRLSEITERYSEQCQAFMQENAERLLLSIIALMDSLVR